MSKAHIRFEVRAIENVHATAEKGYKSYRDADYAVINPVGDKFLELEQEVDEARLAMWQAIPDQRYRIDAYKAWKSGQDAPLNGTPLKEWPVINPSEIKQLESLHVRSVEDLAELNEEGLRRYGIGGQKLKQKAIAWIATGADKGKVVEKIAQQEQMMSQMLTKMEELQKQNAEQAALINAIAAEKSKGKKKDSEAA